MKDESISAFAFNMGRTIEKEMKSHMNNMEEEYKDLESKILLWYAKTKDNEFMKFFNLQKH